MNDLDRLVTVNSVTGVLLSLKDARLHRLYQQLAEKLHKGRLRDKLLNPEGLGKFILEERQKRMLSHGSNEQSLAERIVGSDKQISQCRTSVADAGANHDEGSGPQQARDRGGYRKIFAILLLIDQVDQIQSFIEAGICDEDLPLVHHHDRCKNTSELACRPLAGKQNTGQQRRRNLQEWRPSAAERFCKKQRWVCAALLPDGLRHQIFADGETLPWTSKQDVIPNAVHRKVYKVKVHARHHAFPADKV